MLRMNDHGNTTTDLNRARDLRNNASPYEKKLWVALRESAKSRGLRFRRQQPIHPYIADFACMESRLLVELDGGSHDARQEYDRIREVKLKEAGFVVMRFANDEVKKNVEGVAMAIVEAAMRLIQMGERVSRSSSPLPNPPREGEGIGAVFAEMDR